jgi:hypothetical protein
VENDARVAAYAILADYAEKIANTQAITVFTGVGIAGGFIPRWKIAVRRPFSGGGKIGHNRGRLVGSGSLQMRQPRLSGAKGQHRAHSRRLKAQKERYDKSRLAGAPVEQVRI